MDEILQDMSNVALTTAVEANLFAFGRAMRRWPRAEVHDDPEVLWHITDICFPLFNSVLCADLPPEMVREAIEAVIARGRTRQVPLLWQIGPATRPADLGQALVEHGFVHTGDSSGMAVDLSTLHNEASPDGLTIDRVAGEETLRQWTHVFVLGFGIPGELEDVWQECFACLGLGDEQPLRHYIGWFDGTPVATSTLLLAGGVAGIYNVTVLPDVRGHGFGTAMTNVPLEEARKLGYRVGVLMASPMARNLYGRLGFREYCQIGTYVWQGDLE